MFLASSHKAAQKHTHSYKLSLLNSCKYSCLYNEELITHGQRYYHTTVTLRSSCKVSSYQRIFWNYIHTLVKTGWNSMHLYLLTIYHHTNTNFQHIRQAEEIQQATHFPIGTKLQTRSKILKYFVWATLVSFDFGPWWLYCAC